MIKRYSMLGKFRKAIRVLNKTFNESGLEQHPDKTLIGRTERGFSFLGYFLKPESLFDRSHKEAQNNKTFLNEDILSSSKPLKEAARIGRSKAEKEVLLHTLKECEKDYPKTAAKLNICLASLYNKLNEYHIKN